MLQTVTKKQDEAREKLPKALEIHKKKLLLTFNQNPDGTAEKFSEEDEQLVTYVSTYLLLGSKPRCSTHWDDSIASNIIKKFSNSAHFELTKYLEYAVHMCYAFKNKTCKKVSLDTWASYLLIHARQFGDPTKPIFKNNMQAFITNYPEGKLCSKSPDSATNTHTLSKSSLRERATRLIEELHVAYDDTKFKALNTLTTSITLILLRRFLKNKLHKNYYNIDLCKYLVVEAYLNTDDEKAKKNLQDTCMKYMEWYDLQLPHLFQKVLTLYGIDAAMLWDLLVSIPSKSHQISMSLINLAGECYLYYQVSNVNLLQSLWFPYCHNFGDKYHSNLSDKYNANICMILNSLIEMKDMQQAITDKNISPRDSEWAKKKATELFNKIKK